MVKKKVLIPYGHLCYNIYSLIPNTIYEILLLECNWYCIDKFDQSYQHIHYSIITQTQEFTNIKLLYMFT